MSIEDIIELEILRHLDVVEDGGPIRAVSRAANIIANRLRDLQESGRLAELLSEADETDE